MSNDSQAHAIVLATQEQLRLAAAAPQLLERLKAMVGGAECECDAADDESPMCNTCFSRVVIAKAEGGM